MCIILVVSLLGAGCGSTSSTDSNFSPSYSLLFYQNSKTYLINKLADEDIQAVEYGDTMTVVIPTDSYFQNNSTELNDISGVLTGLNNVVKLVKKYPDANPINVAGFTDDSGDSQSQQSLTQGQAETIATYLWANGVSATSLKTQGYGDSNSIGSNQSTHSSAYNRRIEIQWSTAPPDVAVSPTHACPPTSCGCSAPVSPNSHVKKSLK